MSPRREPMDGPLWRGVPIEPDDAAPLRALFGGHVTELTTETSPEIPPDAYPFRITWWPLSMLGRADVIEELAPLLVVSVERPGPVTLPAADYWQGSVCICVRYADGTDEWVGPEGRLR